VIRNSEVELDLGEKAEGFEKWTVKNDYKDGPDRHPIATRSVTNNKVWEKGRLMYETEYITEYASRERPSIPDSEFTLSAYNLPEPNWGQAKRTPWYLWFGLIGIGCLIAGACARRFSRR
jgi:hypothetical protein